MRAYHSASSVRARLIVSRSGSKGNADYAWKTPTRVAYGTENGFEGIEFGFDVTSKMKSYSWFKLLLDPEQATKFDDPALSRSEGQGVLKKPADKTAVGICADYLYKLAVYAYRFLEKRLSPEILAATPLEFYFTVPAVWSDKAKSDTLRAANQASKMAKLELHQNCQIFLIREPEAAAISALTSLTLSGDENQIKVRCPTQTRL